MRVLCLALRIVFDRHRVDVFPWLEHTLDLFLLHFRRLPTIQARGIWRPIRHRISSMSNGSHHSSLPEWPVLITPQPGERYCHACCCWPIHETWYCHVGICLTVGCTGNWMKQRLVMVTTREGRGNRSVVEHAIVSVGIIVILIVNGVNECTTVGEVEVCTEDGTGEGDEKRILWRIES